MTTRGLVSTRWTDGDKLILISAWINVSTDPIDGVSQKRGSFWKKVLDYYEKTKPTKSRDVDTLRKKWQSLSHDVQKFGGCFDRVKSKRGSGYNEYDFKEQALELYKVEVKKEFVDIKCWEVLRLEPKWMSVCGLNHTSHVNDNRTSQSEDATPVIGSSSPVENESPPCASTTPQSEVRPIGQKAAKRKRNESHVDGKTAAIHAKYLQNVEKMKLEMRRKNDLLYQHNQILIFKEMNKIATLNTTHMTVEQKFLHEVSWNAMVNAMRSGPRESTNPPTVDLGDETEPATTYED